MAPAAAPLVAGALLSGVAAGTAVGFTAGALTISLGFSFSAAATSLALGVLSTALSPKPKTSSGGGGRTSLSSSSGGSFAARAEGMTQNIRQAVTSRRILYGEARIGGALTFVEVTDSNKYLHMVVTLLDHEVASIGEIWLDDTSIPPDALDSNGNVNSGLYSGKVRIKKYLGAAGQVADGDLVAETSATTEFIGNGMTYLYIRLEYDSDVFPSQIPTITAWVRGKKVVDTRDSVTKWTSNAALICNDYLTLSLDGLTPGVGASTTSIDTTELNASANICDEFVTTANLVDTISSANSSVDTLTLEGVNSRLQFQTGDRVQLTGSSLPGGLSAATNYYVIPYQRKGTIRIQLATSLANALAGTVIDISGSGSGTITKNAEPRYYAGGVIETSIEPKSNIDDLLTAMSGSAVYIGGKWKLLAGAYRSPVYSFDENHIISKLVIRPKVSRKDRFNLIKGLYVTPINDGQPADYPSVTNSTYVTADGRTIPIDYDLPMTQRPHTAQRLAKIKLERHRQEIFFEASFSLHACKVQPGDVINITNSRMGWDDKPFEVIKWGLEQKIVGDSPMFYVQMSLQETASTVYDWNNGEETAVDPAPDTNLPNPFVVGLPGAPSLSEELVLTRGGAGVKVKATITAQASTDFFVTKYQFRYKFTTDTEYTTLSETSSNIETVFDMAPGIYDLEVRAINQIGVKSAWVVNTPVEVLGLLVPPVAPTGLTIQAISSFAIIRWDQAVDLDVLEGGTVRFRHSPEDTGATWSTSTSIGNAIPGRAVDTVLPLKPGTYLARFYDSSNIPGDVSTVTTRAATVLEFANIDELVEDPDFTGTKTSMLVDSGELKLGGGGLWDDIPDLDAEPEIDFYGGIASGGTYDFAAGIDLVTVQKVRFTSRIKARVINELDDFDLRDGMIDDWEDFDGTNAGSADATVWVRETDDDPAGAPTWSEWNRLDVGEYEARGFDFQLRAVSDDPAYNIIIEELSVLAVQ